MSKAAPAATAAPKQNPLSKPAGEPVEAPAPAPAAMVAAAPNAGAVTTPGTWRERLAQQAKDAAAKERPSLSKIGLRAGIITYEGQPVKGNSLPVVVMLAAHRNTYYDKPFDPNNLQNPVCFALSLTGDNMEAHENVPDENVPIQEDGGRECSTCPLSQWGSDPKGGRGKACKETRRLVVLPISAIESAEEVDKAEMAILDIPVTSGKNYRNYVNSLAASANVPTWAAVTNISTQPDAQTQFKVLFTPVRVIEDEAVLEALSRKMEQAERVAMVPYDEVSSTEEGKMKDGTGVSQPAKTAKQKF